MITIETINNEIKFRCIPTAEKYYNADSSFGVFTFHTKDKIPEYWETPYSPFDGNVADVRMSTLAGTMQQLYVGSEYEVIATLEYNKKYDTWQYKPSVVTSVMPKTAEQQKRFLLSIMTERQAETLTAKYPNIVDEILAGTDDVDVKQLKGIGDATYKKLKDRVLENYIISDLLIMLQPFGIGYNMVQRLLKAEKNPALVKEKILKNPYVLLELKGFGFKTVDALALKLNPSMQISSKRVYAFMKYYLTEIGNNDGHTWVFLDHLENGIRDNIPECMEIFEKVIQLEQENEVMLHFMGDIVGLKSNYKIEKELYSRLLELNKCKPLKVEQKHIDKGIAKAEKFMGFTLTKEQSEVVLKTLNNNVSIISGSAGTGKTSISTAILNIYAQAGYNISCAALSAKAAQRITEATGFPASTIHRLLEYTPEGFKRNENSPLFAKVILVDECSMINSDLYLKLVRAVQQGAKLIMCGDDKQLPPIGVGNIFSDLLHHSDNEIGVSSLTKVLRQAEKSGILKDANMIRDGKYPIAQPELKIVTGELQDMTYMFRDDREQLHRMAINTFMKAKEIDGLDETVIVTPRKDNCLNSAAEFNLHITQLLFDEWEKHVSVGKRHYFVGSKVMQTVNSPELNVFNGEIGYITEIREEGIGKDKITTIVVDFKMNDEIKTVEYDRSDLGQLDLAYAMTCHKLQGSGVKSVIIVLDMTHYTLLDTCMLYTAITRAKKRCLLLSEPNAFKMCMANNKGKSRQTWLSGMK